MKPYAHVYAHIPFCDYICHYCDFYTVRNKHVSHENFFRALGKERDRDDALLTPQLKALYFGGGTPSASPAQLIADFLAPLRPRLNAGTEVTLEANPWNLSDENLRIWREAGITRLSIGAQSLRTPMLRRLGRAHNADEVRDGVARARKYFENLSADLIYGVPDQGCHEPAEDAEELVRLGVNHFSAYHLTLEPNHFLYSRLPSGDEAIHQVAAIADRTGALGFVHYEASNFGRPGFESENNRNYWRGGPWLAWGPSAHGHDGTRTRWMNIADWKEWASRVEQGKNPEFTRETLTEEQRQIEVLFTSLRTNEGLDLAAFKNEFHRDLRSDRAAIFNELIRLGHGTIKDDRFVPSFSGLMLGDEIVSRLM